MEPARESYPKRFYWLLLTFLSLESASHFEVAQVLALSVGELRCVVSFMRGVLCCPLPDTSAEAVPGHFRLEFDDSSLHGPWKLLRWKVLSSGLTCREMSFLTPSTPLCSCWENKRTDP